MLAPHAEGVGVLQLVPLLPAKPSHTLRGDVDAQLAAARAEVILLPSIRTREHQCTIPIVGSSRTHARSDFYPA